MIYRDGLCSNYAASFPSCSYHCCFLAPAKVAQILQLFGYMPSMPMLNHSDYFHSTLELKIRPQIPREPAGKVQVTTTPFVFWSMRIVGHRANSADGKVVPG